MNVDETLLARLDERTKSIQTGLEKINADIRSNNETTTKKIENLELAISRRMENIEREIKEEYVKKEQFTPIQKIVYGVVAIILSTVLGSLVALVVYKPTQ